MHARLMPFHWHCVLMRLFLPIRIYWIKQESIFANKKKPMIPPHWIPIIMLVLLIAGGLLIMAKYLFFADSNLPTFLGLACILGGLWAATKWR